MRLQLALNVADLDEAIDFYTRMFGVGPAKVRPGYANFAVEQPPLKLVLFEAAGESGSINHLGVETETADEVVEMVSTLSTSQQLVLQLHYVEELNFREIGMVMDISESRAGQLHAAAGLALRRARAGRPRVEAGR